MQNNQYADLIDRIHELDLKVERLIGMVEPMNQSMATTKDIEVHAATCQKKQSYIIQRSQLSRKPMRKKLAIGGGVVGAAATIIYTVVQLLSQ